MPRRPFLLLLPLLLPLPALAQAPLRHAEAVGEILRILDSVPLVAISDVHSLAEEGEFYLRLIRHADTPGRINDLILEVANELYQGLADRYGSGDMVPGDSLRLIWENTTQGPLLTAWSPMYAALLHTVRQVNAGLAPSRRIRILLGDPAVEWRTVTRNQLWEIHKLRGDRLRQLARDSVLAKGRRGIIIAGGNHIHRDRPKGQTADQKWGDLAARVFVVGVHTGFGGTAARFEPVIAPVPNGSLIRIRGSFLAGLELDEVARATPAPGKPAGQERLPAPPPGMRRVNAGLVLADHLDGYLYLGPIRTWTLSWPDLDQLRRDSARVGELIRRSCLMMGRPIDTARLLRRPALQYYPGGVRPDQVDYESPDPPPASPPPLPEKLPEPCQRVVG